MVVLWPRTYTYCGAGDALVVGWLIRWCAVCGVLWFSAVWAPAQAATAHNGFVSKPKVGLCACADVDVDCAADYR